MIARLLTRRPVNVPEQVVIAGRSVPLKVTRSTRARRITVRLLAPETKLGLTLPARTGIAQGLDFIASIEPRIARWLAAQPDPMRLEPGTGVLVEGEMRRIEHAPAIGRQVVLDGDRLRVGGPVEAIPSRVLRWLKARARDDLVARVQQLAARHAIPVAAVALGDARSRWGSCTSSRRIRLSWRLILAPDEVRTYVVAHELAHIRHMDHSPAFWAEVERLGGDRSARGWLRRHGPLLHRIGR